MSSRLQSSTDGAQGADFHVPSSPKVKAGQAAKGGDILILLADGSPSTVDFDLTGQLGQLASEMRSVFGDGHKATSEARW